MRMRGKISFGSSRWIVMLLVVLAAVGFSGVAAVPQPGSKSESSDRIIAQGGGTTIVQGGTGEAGGFIPVLTTLAFHAERAGGVVTGGLECLARAPEAGTGGGSAQFTVNAMYVTGAITEATVNGNTATLSGTSDITGLGAGSGVPFKFVVRNGGPGATAVLTTEGSPTLVFNEVLLEGSFRVLAQEH